MGELFKLSDKQVKTNGNNYFQTVTNTFQNSPKGANPIQIFPNFKQGKEAGLTDLSFNKKTVNKKSTPVDTTPLVNIEELRQNMYNLQKKANGINNYIRSMEEKLIKNDETLKPEEKATLKSIIQELKKQHKEAKIVFLNSVEKLKTGIAVKKIYAVPQNIKTANGKIEDFKQGLTGDCWLLSSLKAISNTEKGAKLLKEIIQKNKDGSVTINLLGANKKYTFTQNDINKRLAESSLVPYADKKFLSRGDVDVLLIEMAVEKEIGEINGDYQEKALQILTGKHTTTIAVQTQNVYNRNNNTLDPNRKMWNLLDYALENPKNLIMTFDTPQEVVNGSPLVNRHAYTIDTEQSTINNIVLINPHNTAKRINVPKDKIKEWCDDITITDLRDYSEYKIQPREHLWGLRKKFHLDSIKSLIIANPELADIEKIRDGKIIRIPEEK